MKGPLSAAAPRPRAHRAALLGSGAALLLASPLLILLALAVARSGLEAPEPSLLVRDRAGRFLGEVPADSREVPPNSRKVPADSGGAHPKDERLGFWRLDSVPERVAAATLVLEDRRFGWHLGVDPLAVARAVGQNARAGRRVSGASTVAMQVARLQRPGDRGYARKAVESATALALVARHGREAVLGHYLRIVPYGHRVHGITYAARRFLDKPVEDLSWAEVAFLSSIPQSPARHDPFSAEGRARALRRAWRILVALEEAGHMKADERLAAEGELDALRLPWRATRPAAALHPLLALRDQVAAHVATGPVRAPLLTTTLDLDLQTEVEHLAWTTVVEAEDRGAGNAAALVVELGRDAEPWRVRAAVGSAGYFDVERAGAIDYLRLPRSAGSTLKPLLYAMALDEGTIGPATVLDDLGPGPGGILNADDRFLGPMLPRLALANSRNVPAVELLSRVGLDRFYAALGSLGVHRNEGASSRYGLGLAIGSLPVTLETLVGAYTALAGDGSRRPLTWIEPAGSSRVEEPQSERFVREDSARLVTLFLADPQARLPSFPRLGPAEYPFPVAVKTGTSSRYRDAWTIAWSRRYLVGVWVGHPDARPMGELSGSRIAARFAHRILERLHREDLDGLDASVFPPPRGHRVERLCAVSGQVAREACARVTPEWVPVGRELPGCGVHRWVDVEVASARGPSADDSSRRVQVDLPARYAGWLARQGGQQSGRTIVASVAGASAAEPHLEILSPEPGARLLFDPEAPPARNTLALRVLVDPAVEQVVWYVDGRPFATVDRPYTSRWPLSPGEHFIQARLPFGGHRSRTVRVVVE